MPDEKCPKCRAKYERYDTYIGDVYECGTLVGMDSGKVLRGGDCYRRELSECHAVLRTALSMVNTVPANDWGDRLACYKQIEQLLERNHE